MAYPGRTDAIMMGKIAVIDASLDVTLAIDTANELVTEVCASVLASDGVTPYYSSSRLVLIETWLACHFYCINDPQAKRERLGPITFEAQSQVDLGLDVTHYGQQAKRLDTKGGLALLDQAIKDGKTPGKVTIKLKWLGKSYCDGVPTPCGG